MTRSRMRKLKRNATAWAGMPLASALIGRRQVEAQRGEIGRISPCSADYCYANARVYPIKPSISGVKFGQKF